MLAKPLAVLEQRYRRLDLLFDETYLCISRAGYSRLHRMNAMEGALSVAWQTWCGFCREVYILSLKGTTTTTGTHVPAVDIDLTAGRIAYTAKQLVAGKSINEGKFCAPHNEPTWGDPRFGLELADHFCPANSSSLRIGLNLDYHAPEHMRTVRNAAAHFSAKNIELFLESGE